MLGAPNNSREHPVVAWIGLIAILLAILLVVWASFETKTNDEVEASVRHFLRHAPPAGDAPAKADRSDKGG